MLKKMNWKRMALAGLLLILLLGISGCLKPDRVEDLPDDPSQVVLPFATATATPTLPPADPNQGGDAGTGTGLPATATEPPVVATPTVQLITASPPPAAVWTYSPSPATAAPTDNGTLRNGDSGQAVKNLQQRLKDLKYYSGSVDGDFGAGTESALKAFQKANGLTADGIAGSRTLSTLNSSNAKTNSSSSSSSDSSGSGSKYATSKPTPKTYTPSTLSPNRKYLQLGSSGSEVKRLQERLKELGYFNGSVNGNFGEDTQAALEAFQKRNGQYVDGVAGEDTQNAVFSSNALPASSGSSNKINNNNSVPSTGYRTLSNGLSGDDVALMQTRLQELGYFSGGIDGKFEASTVLAVQVFQQINGLTADGVAGPTTQARMYSSNALYAPTTEITTVSRTAATLELGSMGEEVIRLQERLYELGYYTGSIDGIYTDVVSAAVSAFQRANKLTVDGKAGRNTQTKIYASSAVKAAGVVVDDTYSALKQGDTGERVKALQTLLATYGYFTDTVNGTYGVSTFIAVQQLQAQHGLATDGVAGPATLQLLYQGSPQYAAAVTEQSPQQNLSYITLKQGANSPDVTMLQQFLQEMGYFYDEADGVFGASTLLAVQAFQARNGLKADGVAGQETLALLYSGDGVPAESLGQYTEETPERTSMKQGDEGQDVFSLQERLQILGYLSSAPDGKYGGGTTTAVKDFQSKNGIKADGVAGPETITAMYAASAVVAGAAAAQTQQMETVSNRNRELEEQNASGAIQGSLAGGGIAASYGSGVYYAGRGGTLYRISGESDKQIFNGQASFIHASDKGVTFVSGNKVMRVSTNGGSAEVLATGKKIQKMSVFGNTVYYLDNGELMKTDGKSGVQTLATGLNDFTIDVYQYAAYTASPSGIRSFGLTGSGEQLLVSTSADQVMLSDSVVFFRSGGNIYRVQNGVSVLLVEAEASWMGIYREMIYYTSSGKLFRCDTTGLNNTIFFSGTPAEVSFVSGKVYITEKKGGEVTQILSAE